MANASIGNNAAFRVQSKLPEAQIYALRFATNGASSPLAANTVDDAKLVNTIVRDGVGSIVVTLKAKYKRVYVAGVNMRSSSATARANADASVEGTTAASSISVTTFDGVTAAADLSGVVVELVLVLTRR